MDNLFVFLVQTETMQIPSTLKLFCYSLLLLTISACARVNYIGNSYAPTQRVEIFYEEEQVQDNYEVIGKAVASSRNDEQGRNALLKRAQEEGADAILIEDLTNSYFQDSNNNTDSRLQIKAKFYRKKQ
jgi:hypothetical protein